MVEVLKAILRFLGEVLTWVVDFVEWLVVKFFVMLFDAVVALFSLIPVPEFLTELAGNVLAIDPGVLYFAAPFQLGTGVTWLIAAYTIRFLIRRIPLVG